MQSDTADCTSEYYTSNEIIDENSSPIHIEVASTDENDINEDQNGASRRSSQVKQEVKEEEKKEISPEEGAKKRKNDILDDFFALGEPSIKKKKKKSKKLKHAHRDATDEDNTINTALNIQHVTDSVGEDIYLDVEEITLSKTRTPNQKEKALPNRMGSVTPPPVFDKEALLAKRMKLERLSDANSFDIEDDDDDLEILQQPSYRRSHTPSGSQSGNIGYQFTDENESKRNYILKVTSKLVDGTDIDSTFRTKGTNRFSKTLDSIISYFLRVQKGVEYTSDDVSVIWIDGRMEIKPFFKPSTLRVQPVTLNGGKKNARASTYLYCLLIPKSNLETFTSTYSEFETSASSLKKITDLTDEIEQIDEQEHDDTSMHDASDIGDGRSISSRPIVIDLDEEDNESYFVIGLKGKDNKRIEVQVSPVTQIRKLLLYFLKTKGINESEVNMKTVKLIFDDEELNLDDVVGDTELEEDFEVQVVI